MGAAGRLASAHVAPRVERVVKRMRPLLPAGGRTIGR